MLLTPQPPTPTTTEVAVVGTVQQPSSPPVIAVGLDWAVLIPIIVTGLSILLGQVLNYLKSRDNGRKSDAIAETNTKQSSKLERIEILVDGRYGQVLQELADVKRLLAAESGLDVDKLKADEAQQRADEQIARVAASNALAPADPPRIP